MQQADTLSSFIEPITQKKCRIWRWLGIAVLLLLLIVCGCGYGLYHVYQTQLKPQAGEWSHTVQVGSYEVPVSIPGAIRLATTPFWGRALTKGLSGKQKQTVLGDFSLDWDEANDALVLECRNCVIGFGGLHSDPLRITQIRLLIHQESTEKFSGDILIGQESHQIKLPWQGELSAQSFKLQLGTNAVAIEDIFHNLVPDLPELERAKIAGTVTLQGTLELPSFQYTVEQPEIRGFTVSGLGTEQLRYVESSCGMPSNLPMNSWLVRSIIAAEDQRFEQHPGYDMYELMQAYDTNLTTGGIVRGGSTITQQTAKMLFTGSDRTLKRKLQEILYAVEMERTLGKVRIMQLYLDNAVWGLKPDGRLLCGAQAASDYYFQTTPVKLKPEQAVWLAAMLHSPMTEQREWEKVGRINMGRAIWIADQVRNAPNSGPKARKKLIRVLRKNPGLGIKVTPSKVRTK